VHTTLTDQQCDPYCCKEAPCRTLAGRFDGVSGAAGTSAVECLLLLSTHNPMAVVCQLVEGVRGGREHHQAIASQAGTPNCGIRAGSQPGTVTGSACQPGACFSTLVGRVWCCWLTLLPADHALLRYCCC
jgi:hypothetical protein